MFFHNDSKVHMNASQYFRLLNTEKCTSQAKNLRLTEHLRKGFYVINSKKL